MAKKVIEPIKKKAENIDTLTRIDAAIEKRKNAQVLALFALQRQSQRFTMNSLHPEPARPK